MRRVLVAAWVAMACGDGQGAARMDAARASALRAPGDVPEDWQPDVRLWLAPRVVRDAVQIALEQRGPLTTTLRAGPAVLEPNLEVTSLEVSGTRRAGCASCLSLDVTVQGRSTLRGLPGLVAPSVRAQGGLDLELTATRQGDEVLVTARPVGLHDVAVELEGVGRLGGGLVAEVEAFVVRALSAVEPQSVARLGAADLPLRAARFEPTDEGVAIALLTDSPTSTPVRGPARGKASFVVRASSETLVGLARRAAFQAGPQQGGVLAEPLSLALDADGFSADVRVWVEGGGCAGTLSQDLTVKGTVAVDGRRVVLEATSLRPTGATDAGLLEPALARAEAAVLARLQEALVPAIPSRTQADLGGHAADVRLLRVEGDAGDVLVRGRIDLDP